MEIDVFGASFTSFSQRFRRYSGSPRRKSLPATAIRSNAFPRPTEHFKQADLTYDGLAQSTDKIINAATSSSTPINSSVSADDCFRQLEAWLELSKQNDHGLEAANQARRLLKALEQNLIEKETRTFLPKSIYYNTVLQSYAASYNGSRKAAEQAQQLLNEWLDLCRSFALSGDCRARHLEEPTIQSYNILINCWAKSGTKDAGQQAEAVLQQMQGWRIECQAKVKSHGDNVYNGVLPTDVTITSILDAWAQSGHPDAPERAFAILDQVLESKSSDHSTSGHNDLFQCAHLGISIFNSAINVWVRSGRGREAATKAEDILKLLVDLNERSTMGHSLVANVRTFSLVIDAWARCEKFECNGDAAQRAEDILTNMVYLYRKGLDLKPNTYTYTSCIKAWAQSKSRYAPDNAKKLFSDLINLYEETRDSDLKPNEFVGNAVMSSWANAMHRKHCIPMIIDIMDTASKFYPTNIVAYNILLDAMRKRGESVAALELLNSLEREGENEDSMLIPDRTTYNTVLSALAREGRVDDVQALMSRMDMLERSDVRPDKWSFKAAIDALTQSTVSDKAARAEVILIEMLSRYRSGNNETKPDAYTFSAIIEACDGTEGDDEVKRHSLFLAMKVMEQHETDEYGPPYHVLYVKLARAIFKLADSPAEKFKLLADLYTHCGKLGVISQEFVHTIAEAVPEIVQKRMEQHWYRNVPLKYRS
jgi:pentatricopeptide repeat protein